MPQFTWRKKPIQLCMRARMVKLLYRDRRTAFVVCFTRIYIQPLLPPSRPIPRGPDHHPFPYCHVSETVVALEAGTVMVWLGSDSHVTDPSLPTLMYLYSMTAPGVSSTVTTHSGSAVVYSDAESATASSVSQLPSAATDPAILIVSPYDVVTVSSNVTATAVAVAVAVLDVDVLLVVLAVVVALLVVVAVAVVVALVAVVL